MNEKPKRSETPFAGVRAFTLIELLVVIGIIGILASMLLPSLTRGRQKTRVVQCLNNLHQIGMAIAMYVQDNKDSFPIELVCDKGTCTYTFWCIGGRDPTENYLPAEHSRPLYPYLKPSEVFHCPEDHGLTAHNINRVDLLKPTCWEAVGCSYMYNVRWPFGYQRTRQPEEEPARGLAGRKIGWVPDPTRFILMFEPPARSFRMILDGAPMHMFQHWHFAPQTTDWPQDRLPQDGAKFISPILFVDGHAASHDFTKSIRTDPDYVFEETKNWIWYKPAPQPVASH